MFTPEPVLNQMNTILWLASEFYGAVVFEVFTAVTMNGVFWDVTTCGSCKNRRFGGT
jgi:hypothetical protein